MFYPWPVLTGWPSICRWRGSSKPSAATGTASIRRRRLPAEQVVWLVIALALYRHQSMPEVLATLDLALPCQPRTAPSARVRSPKPGNVWEAEPLARCSVETAQSLVCARYVSAMPGRDSSLWAMDGTTFRTPDSADNRRILWRPVVRQRQGRQLSAGRAVSVTAIPTHLVADMAFGQYGQNEMLYAKTLIERIADHSLTVFDRGFLCAEILLGLTMAGEAASLPDSRQVQYEVGGALRHRGRWPRSHAGFAPGACQSASSARILDSACGAYGLGQRQGRILLTSLLDRRRFKAEDLAECYRRRWEIETSYRELKQSMLASALTLRSQQPRRD